MKVIHFIVFTAYFTSTTIARLIEKNTDKIAESETTEAPFPVRISRQVFYDDSFGMSKEDSTQEDESRTYVRRGRYSIKSKSSKTKAVTIAKETSVTAAAKKQTETEEVQTKSTIPLIKRPIPKFNDVDYEDFQGKINKSPAKLTDSGEHEDEDFNLDDYEFDVNHDEFAGRGKPLEPRMKIKESKAAKKRKSPKPKTTLPPPEIKMQSKVVIPTEPPEGSKKSIITKKAADKMKEDYYDDVVTTTKVPESEKKRDLDDEFPDDNDDSKELNRKNPVRVARSPWFVEFLGERMGQKTAAVMSKILNVLPKLSKESAEYVDRNPSDNIMTDPLTGRDFPF